VVPTGLAPPPDTGKPARLVRLPARASCEAIRKQQYQKASGAFQDIDPGREVMIPTQPLIDVTSLLEGEWAENELRKDWTVSERVAILRLLDRLHGQGGDRRSKRPGVLNQEQAAKLVGFGSHDTAHHAEYLVDHAPPELLALVLGLKISAGETDWHEITASDHRAAPPPRIFPKIALPRVVIP
jgi:hypothetical protein